jgi:hypothetical protein
MTREEALSTIDELVKMPNIRKHCLATEAVMLSIWDYLESQGRSDLGSREDWGVVGLLHDADYEVTDKDLEKHTKVIEEKLKKSGEKQEIINGILAHAERVPKTTPLEKAIFACDELTGLIVAAALVLPDKKLANLKVESVEKRFREPAFARAVDRGSIKTCESDLGIPLLKFCEIALLSMQKISGDLGL